jgi:mRNA interferase RelE/StbE
MPCCRESSENSNHSHNPRPAGAKKLKGYKHQWRVRVGDWRILYIIDNAAKLVSVTRIAHRREVYDK